MKTNNLYKKEIIYCILFLLSTAKSFSFSQWNAVSINHEVDSVFFSLCNKVEFIHTGFFFSPFYPKDSIHDRNFLVQLEKIKDAHFNNFLWEYNASSPTPVKKNAFFIVDFYASDIDSISILLHDDDGIIMHHKITVSHDGFQIPHLSTIDNWDYKINDTSLVEQRLKDGLFLNKISMLISSNNKNPRLIIKDLKLFNIKREIVDFKHPFFQEIKKAPLIQHSGFNSFYVKNGLNHLLTPFSFYTIGDNYSEPHILNPDNINENIIISEITEHALMKYHYYNEKNIDKEKAILNFNKYNQFIDSLYFLDSLEVFINSFNDVHFSLQIQKNRSTKEQGFRMAPIRVVYVDRSYQVGAVFDSDLSEKILPGDKILSINGIPISKLVDSLMNLNKGGVETKRAKALSRLLYKKNTDTITISYIHNNIEQELSFVNNIRSVIPPNFRPAHMSFRTLPNDVLYIKMNTWKLGDFIKFYNHFHSNSYKYKTIVLDLRNNGGGDERSSTRIASSFIKEPKVYSHHFYKSYNDEIIIRESLVLYPNELINLNHLKVIILVNERTACASEMFTIFMKENANAVVVGSEQTQGTYSYLHCLNFESGNRLCLNSFEKVIPPDNIIIENKGIIPDIWVNISKVVDLAPYNDKVLKTALKLSAY